jgi:hypothetical protein
MPLAGVKVEFMSRNVFLLVCGMMVWTAGVFWRWKLEVIILPGKRGGLSRSYR